VKLKGHTDLTEIRPDAFEIVRTNKKSWSGTGESKKAFDDADTLIGIIVEDLEVLRRALDMALRMKGLYAPEKREHTGASGQPIQYQIVTEIPEPHRFRMSINRKRIMGQALATSRNNSRVKINYTSLPKQEMFHNLPRPKLDLAEYQVGSRDHLTVQFSEFDITTFGSAFGIANTIAVSTTFLLINPKNGNRVSQCRPWFLTDNAYCVLCTM
jgi:hypothetical protein